MPTKEELEQAIREKSDEFRELCQIESEAKTAVRKSYAERESLERQLNALTSPFAIGDKVTSSWWPIRGATWVVVAFSKDGALVSPIKKDGTPGVRTASERFANLTKV